MTGRGPALALSALLVACGALHGERPAVIATPTAATRTELMRVVALAVNGAPVTLADDAFTRDGVLIVQRRTPAGPQGRVATGRDLEVPARLRLVLDGARCALVRDSDERRFALQGVACVPLESAR